MTTKAETKESIFDLLLAIISIPIGILLRSYVLMMLWAWYIVPQFGLSPLRMVFAFGLCSVVSFLVPGRAKAGEEMPAVFVKAVALNLMALLFGYIGTFFI